eukprot:TRINITY_DN7977_c0_g1_i2.p1 TRINITY_DN7977_c0_g1~~TRINITY_DN7977_c0_g1_i2.p1  ORF type:complete len:491 (+),score=93.02 TRINITY_DN7977_c0_g1_i2:195-1667(+)
MEEKSDFEKQRLKNIEVKEKLFKDLLEARAKLKPKRKIASEPGKYKKSPPPPREKSSRIAKAAKENERLAAIASDAEEKLLRTLELQDLYFSYGQHEASQEEVAIEFEDFVDSMSLSTYRNKSNVASTEDVQSYLSRLASMEDRFQKAKAPEKLVMRSITSTSIHPDVNTVLVGAGNVEGKLFLGRFSPALDGPLEEFHFFTPHDKSISHQTWNRFNPEELITSSHDGTVKIFDIRNLEASVLYGDVDFMAEEGKCSTHAQVDKNTFLVSREISGERVLISLIDSRVYSRRNKDFRISFQAESINSIDVHPTNSDLILVAPGGSPNLGIFDLRNVSVRGRAAIPLAKLKHSFENVRAHFSPITGNKVIASNENVVQVFDTENVTGGGGGSIEKQASVTDGDFDRLDTLGCWHPKFDNLYFRNTRTSSPGNWQIRTFVTGPFPGQSDGIEIGDAIPCVQQKLKFLSVHPTLDVILGFSSWGKISLFQQSTK